MFLASLIILGAALVLLGVTLWNVLAWPKVSARGGAARAGSVSVLIPARDEEANIAACLDAALSQGEVVAEVLVYDDHSADATARLVTEYAARDPRVRLVRPAALPAGWCGKNFACDRLAAHADARWLLFLDADARLREGAAARIVAEAEARAVTFLSCWPGQEMRGFWERALMPLLNFVVFTLYPAPLADRRADASLGLAHGACVLAGREAYARVGGHAAVRDAINEDVRLAQHWRARGEPGLCLDGQDVVSVRMYRGLREVWAGFQKNFYPFFRSDAGFWLFLLLHFAVFLLPLLLAPLATGTAAAHPLRAAAACVVMMRAALALRFGHPWWSVLLHPLGEAFLLARGLTSWLRCKTGRGVEWKGRRYREA